MTAYLIRRLSQALAAVALITLLLFGLLDLAPGGPAAAGVPSSGPFVLRYARWLGVFSRYLRTSAADSLARDYVRTARALGAGERRVLLVHVLPNALIDVITLAGLSIPQILGGALVTESVFSIQGMGWQLWQAAQNRDYPVLLGFTLVTGIGAVAGSLLADLGDAASDPRLRRPVT